MAEATLELICWGGLRFVRHRPETEPSKQDEGEDPSELHGDREQKN